MRFFLNLAVVLIVQAAAFAGIPQWPGYTESAYSASLGGTPTHMAWAPDGSRRLFVAIKEGALTVVQPDGSLKTWYTFPVKYTESECGVLGVCFDPDFLTNGYVYVFVTVSKYEQRIIRFQEVNGRATGAINLVRGLPTRGRNHDGGALGFGPDARLYWGVGDCGVKLGVDNDVQTLAAKVGRAFWDGSVPRDNPYFGRSGANGFIFAQGFRNPYGLSFHPVTGELWLGVVGSSPEGQTVPRTTAGYEQIFVVGAGDHGGYDNLEGNQKPGAEGYRGRLIQPALQYRTNYGNGNEGFRAIKGIDPSVGRIVVTFNANHPFRKGEWVRISGTGAYDGPAVVEQVVAPTAISIRVPEGDNPEVQSQGEVRAISGQGCVIEGAFNDGTAFSEDVQGAYYFGDLNSGQITGLRLNAQFRPERARTFLKGAGPITDITFGPDGALYYANTTRRQVFRVANIVNDQRLAVSATHLRLLEGGRGSFSVALKSAPTEPVEVTLSLSNPLFSIVGEAKRTFTSSNWSVPQAVELKAARDSSSDELKAELTLSAPGYPDVGIAVAATDTGVDSPALSATDLTVAEGQSASFSVKLAKAPLRPVTVGVRLLEGSKGIQVVKGKALVFTTANWEQPRTVEVRVKAGSSTVEETGVIQVRGRGQFPAQVLVRVREPQPK